MLQPFGVKTNVVLGLQFMRNVCRFMLGYAQYCLTWRAHSATMMILAFMLQLLLGVPLWTVTKSIRFYTRIKVINYVSYATNIWINTIIFVCWIITCWNVQIISVYIVFCFKSVPYKLWLCVLSIHGPLNVDVCAWSCEIKRYDASRAQCFQL